MGDMCIGGLGSSVTRVQATLHLGREVIEPALAALLAHASGEMRGDLGPFRRPVLL